MKTNEFREYLKSEWDFIEYNNYFEIHDIGKIFKSSNAIIDLCLTNSKCDLFSKIYEYAITPLEEREEEEKKYYLRFPSGFNQILTYLGLSMRGYDCVGIDSSELYKKQFTQKEIDAMPFDTNFFIKEEVI